ncbi:MAG TPA: hypothetical protein VL069_04795 [Opitutus sp.]|nr:hypothetical protein [Opitutus sp.]
MALSSDAVLPFKSETVRGVRGFFCVGQTHADQWWLIGPDDLPFFARAVNDVRAAAESRHDPVVRMRSWGFNALGPGADAGLLDEGLPFVRTIGFANVVPLIRAKAVRLPDVFDPTWNAAADRRANEVCSLLTMRTDLLGWLTDDDLAWGGTKEAGVPSLLQTCLSLEPNFAAYHAAWEFVLAPHGGQIARLGKAWGCSLENKGVVRELTRSDQALQTSGHARDDARWTREFAQRYFAGTSAAIRAHDPNHLILGARDLSGAHARGAAWLSECVFPAVDVAWIHTRDIKTAPAGPVFAGHVFWISDPHQAAVPRSRARGVTSFERMLRQGRASLRATIAHPSVVGYSWNLWRDDPGEQPPFAHGLVHLNDVEAREHTELLTDLNGRIGSLRPFGLKIAR